MKYKYLKLWTNKEAILIYIACLNFLIGMHSAHFRDDVTAWEPYLKYCFLISEFIGER